MTVFLVDHEQRHLRSLPSNVGHLPAQLPIASTLAGRSFMTLRPLPFVGHAPGLWMPVVDGTERFGVLQIGLPTGMEPSHADVLAGCRWWPASSATS